MRYFGQAVRSLNWKAVADVINLSVVYVTTQATNAQEGGTQISGVVKRSVLEARGIAAGTPIYFKVYPSGASNVLVEDFLTGSVEYTDVLLDQGSAVLGDVMR